MFFFFWVSKDEGGVEESGVEDIAGFYGDVGGVVGVDDD